MLVVLWGESCRVLLKLTSSKETPGNVLKINVHLLSFFLTEAVEVWQVYVDVLQYKKGIWDIVMLTKIIRKEKVIHMENQYFLEPKYRSWNYTSVSPSVNVEINALQIFSYIWILERNEDLMIFLSMVNSWSIDFSQRIQVFF